MQSYETILSGMESRYKELTGFEADSASDIGIRLKVLAGEIAGLYSGLETFRQQAFPQTATGQYLDYHGEARGIRRKNAQPAAGILRFSRENPATADIVLAKGVVCATRPNPQVQFETTQAVVLPAGSTQVEAPAKAVEPGELGNVAGGAVCLMVAAPPGITAVTNPEGFSGGVDEESDDRMRQRLLAAYQNISNGANAAYYRNIALSFDEVASVNVISRARGRGTVDVVVKCHSKTEENQVLERLRALLKERRELNVDIQVLAAQPKSINLSVQILEAPGYDLKAVSMACQDTLIRYIGALGVGEPLLAARTAGVLMEVEGVYNCAVASPAGDVAVAGNQVVDAALISVSRMMIGG